METLAFVSLGLCLVLLVASFLLYVDTRGERAATVAAHKLLADKLDLLRTDHDALAVRVGAVEAIVRPDLGVARVVAPLSAQPAPAALPVRVVAVTRDDDPAHTRATVVAPPPAPARAAPPHAPPVKVAPLSVPVPSTVPKQSTDRNVRPEDAAARRRRVLNEATIAEGRRARGEDPRTGEPRVVLPAPPGVARALGARGTMLGLGVESDDDRPTDEGVTRVWSAEDMTPTAVSPRPEGPAERDLGTDLSPEVLARVDALADEQGISREEMLRKLARQGTAAEEKRRP